MADEKATFDYKQLEGQIALPETIINLTGEQFMRLLGGFQQFIDQNSSGVIDHSGKVIGSSLAPYAAPVSELYSMLYREVLKTAFEEGKTISFADFQQEMQARQMAEIQKAKEEEDLPQSPRPSGQALEVEEKVVSKKKTLKPVK